ncbi:MAG: hypothetical protein WC284_17715 [Candidimonas sp.]
MVTTATVATIAAVNPAIAASPDRFEETIRLYNRVCDLYDANVDKDNLPTFENPVNNPANRIYMDALEDLFVYMDEHFDHPTEAGEKEIRNIIREISNKDLSLNVRSEVFPVIVTKIILVKNKIWFSPEFVPSWRKFSDKYSVAIRKT